MKKTTLVLFTVVTAGLLAQSALATITFSTNQASYNVAPGSTVNVTLQVTTTGSPPTNVDGFDTIFEATANQNSVADISPDFSISTAAASQGGWISSGSSYPATFSTSFSDHTGFTQTQLDNGFFDFNAPAGAVALPGTVSLATYTFSIAAGTPLGTYTFGTTPGAYTSSGGGASTRFSRIADSSGTSYPINTPATFTFVVSAVPEPATWSLLGFGGLGSFGLTLLRARRKG